MSHTSLIPVADLAAHRHDPAWIVFDCRHDLARPEAGPGEYAEGHLPDAHFLHADHDLAGPRNGKNGRHPLPTVEALVATLSRFGVDGSKQVIAYDAQGGMMAARLWWMLRWLGHDRVAVLDGGLQQWVAAGHSLSIETPRPVPARFTPSPRGLMVDAAFVQAQIGADRTVVIDARAADRYRGENETLDPVGGHIPGARNRPFRDNLDADGRFKPAERLRAEYGSLLGALGPDQTIHSCGSGVSACHNLLAMAVAGLPGGRLYAGSWSEWCADPRRPVAVGPTP